MCLKEEIKQTKQNKEYNMNVAIWDTYVTKKDGSIMHFDIVAPDEIQDPEVIYNFGKEYLKTKSQDGHSLSSKQCRFCHIEKMKIAWEKSIKDKGYFIIEMENCN